jgi:hypothetical protein
MAIESRSITMKDGRVVAFGTKQRMNKTHAVNAAGSVALSIDFDNGETVVVEVAPGSPVGLQALGHGLSQKLGDAAAGADSTEDAFESVLEIAGRIANGEWKKQAEAGTGGSAKGASELVEALSRVLGQTKENVRARLATLDQADKLALRKTPKVAAAIEALRLERGPSKADKDKAETGASLLSMMESGEMPAPAVEGEGKAKGKGKKNATPDVGDATV